MLEEEIRENEKIKSQLARYRESQNTYYARYQKSYSLVTGFSFDIIFLPRKTEPG